MLPTPSAAQTVGIPQGILQRSIRGLSLLLALTGASAASAAPAGFTELNRTNGCIFYKGNTEANGIQAVRAECDWEVDPEKVRRLLAKSEDHDLYFTTVTKCDVLSRTNGVDRAYQLHEAAGISPREVIIDMASEPIPGGRRFTWTRSADQTGLTGGGVAVEHNTGKWEVTDKQGGGTHLVYELRYAPGGMVPSFMVRWFQGAGTEQLVGELLSYAKAH